MLETTHVGLDKVQRYNWTVVDEPGQFMSIHKDKLLIDHENYQRLPREGKILELARNWSHVACGALLVARRLGKFYVMDGQYRTEAARRRSDIKELPCMVFDTADVREEAEGFLKSNTNRKPITSRDRFRALITKGDENAHFVDSLLRGAGRGLDAGVNAAQCLTALLRASEASRPALVAIWPIVDRLCQGRSIHTNVLRGLIRVESLMPEGQSLAQRKWRDRILATGFDELLDATRKAEGFRGVGGERVWAEGILARLNKGLQKKLELRDPGSGR